MKDPKKTVSLQSQRQGAAPRTVSSAGVTSDLSYGATIGQSSEAKVSKTIIDEKYDVIRTPEIAKTGRHIHYSMEAG